MIVIKNLQRRFVINKKKIEAQLICMLKELAYENFDLSLIFVSEKRMQEYNNQYRKKNAVTDILSFPFHHALKPGKRINVTHQDEANLGDILICPARVARDAEQLWQRSFDEHLTTLLAHGIAHLLNYDHETEAQYKQMQKIEIALLQSLVTQELLNK